MRITCQTCKYSYESTKDNKCPRCGFYPIRKNDCENCKSCSVWKSCKIEKIEKGVDDV